MRTEIDISKRPPTPRRELWSKEYACSQCSFKTKDQEELNFHYSVHDKKQKDSVLVSGNASPKALTGSLEHEQNTDKVKKGCDENFASVQTDRTRTHRTRTDSVQKDRVQTRRVQTVDAYHFL